MVLKLSTNEIANGYVKLLFCNTPSILSYKLNAS